MSSQEGYEFETSGSSTSSEFGSLEEKFKFPPAHVATRSATKRRAPEKVEELDEMLKASLILSPEKRLRLHSSDDAIMNSRRKLEMETEEERRNGRPPTRRSTSIDRSPRIKALRAKSTGSPINAIRSMNALCTDSISPKLMSEYGLGSPSKRQRHHHHHFGGGGGTDGSNGGGGVYQKHRLGAMFSPLVAGGKKKPATPHHSIHRGVANRSSPMDSPRHSGGLLRSRGTARGKLPLSDRLNLLD